MRRIFILLFFFTLFTSILHAQEDYIVQGGRVLVFKRMKLTQPDGIQKYRELIREDKAKQKTIYTPNDIDEFSIDGKLFFSYDSPVERENEKIFLLQLLKDDEIAIYQYENTDGKHFFFQEGDKLFEPITATSNPYADYLDKHYKVGVQHTELYYEVEPTSKSILLAYKLAKTQNPNYITGMRYGIRVGGDYSWMTNDYFENTAKDYFVTYGVFLNQPIYNEIGVQVELFYYEQAYSSTKEFKELIVDTKYHARSISMPVMLHYRVNQLKENLVPYLHAGPAINFRLKQNMGVRNFNHDIYDTNFTYPADYTKNNYMYLAFQAGLGVEYKLNRKHSLFIDTKYMKEIDGEYGSNLIYLSVSFNF